MRKGKNQFYSLIILAVIVSVLSYVFYATTEHYRNRRKDRKLGSPSYCNSENSCTAQGCSLDPNNQPCDRSRTIQKTISVSDPDWGDMLGGQTVEVCADTTGAMMDPNTCSECSVCGLLYPQDGNTSGGLCVPLTPKGCMQNAPTGKLLNYLNNNPESISCCGN